MIDKDPTAHRCLNLCMLHFFPLSLQCSATPPCPYRGSEPRTRFTPPPSGSIFLPILSHAFTFFTKTTQNVLCDSLLAARWRRCWWSPGLSGLAWRDQPARWCLSRFDNRSQAPPPLDCRAPWTLRWCCHPARRPWQYVSILIHVIYLSTFSFFLFCWLQKMWVVFGVKFSCGWL